jgi:Septum formation
MSDFPQPPPRPSPDQPPPDFPQPPPPDQPLHEFPRLPRNGLGIAALSLGIIGAVTSITPWFFWVAGILGVIGLIVGFGGRARAKRGEATNGTMALWGIITSAVAVVVAVIVSVVTMGSKGNVEVSGPELVVVGGSPAATTTIWPAPAETSAPARADAEEVSTHFLEVGDCIADSVPGGGEEIFSVPTVPCSEPHAEEVYAALTLPERDFPGMDALFQQGEELCMAEFESFVGVPYEESALYLSFLTPSEESWSNGDRQVICTIYDPDGETTGTLADANR